MSLINDKKNVFTEIGALNSISNAIELPEPTNSLPSINNNRDIGAFLIDILVTLVGSEVLKKVNGELLGDFIIDTKPTLKDELKTQFLEFDAENSLSSDFINNGITVPVKKIDPYGKLQTDPLSNVGELIYSDNGSPDRFDRRAYEAITVPNTEITYNNISIRYNDASDTFTFKPTNVSQNIRTFTNEFIDGMYLFDKKTFVIEILNIIFGTISNAQGKTEQQILEENKLNATIDKFIDGDEDLTISDDELAELQNDARQVAQGFREVCIGCCDILEGSMTIEEMSGLTESFINANDPDEAGNILGQGILDSFNDIGQFDDKNQNQQTIKDGLLKRIIKAILRFLVAAITSTPEAKAILAIVSAFRNNGTPELDTPINDLLNFKDFIKCLVKKATELIMGAIFVLVKEELLKLIIPISKEILREKINQYIGILRSLVSFG